MQTRKLLRALAQRYPKRLAEGYDHVGLQIGILPEETGKVMLCLDFDRFLLEEALAFRPDLIITHHPFFFGPPKKVREADPEKDELAGKLEKERLTVYSFHTNFDKGAPGMNDELARRLGLKDVRPLAAEPCARGGELPEEMGVHEFAEYAKKALGAPYGRLVAEGKRTVKTAAIIGGGGSYAWRIAKDEGYDIYISGDAPHHAFREIKIAGYDYLDLPHEIETAFIQRMGETLKEIDPALEIKGFEHEVPPELV